MSINVKKLDYIENVLDNALAKDKVVGGTVCIIDGNREVYRKHFGYANREISKKVTDDTIFRMFSMTKPITAVATLILIERGILDYNDNVAKYLDGFKNVTVMDETTKIARPFERGILIRDLLTMTSGLVYPGDWSESCRQMATLFNKNTESLYEGKGGMSTVDFCNAMGKVPLTCEPNTRWVYGTSADVLGAIIEVATGKPFGQFLQDEIFTPLGMVDTGFYIPQEKYHRLAQAYYYNSANKHILLDFINLCITNYRTPPKFESGGAGLVSTINDYKQFAKMLINEGTLNDARILSRKSVELMRTPYLNGNIENEHKHEGYNYGCLVRVLEDKQLGGTNASLGEFGWDGWTGNYFCVDPVEKLSIMYFIQECGTGFTEEARKIRAITYGAIE